MTQSLVKHCCNTGFEREYLPRSPGSQSELDTLEGPGWDDCNLDSRGWGGRSTEIVTAEDHHV